MYCFCIIHYTHYTLHNNTLGVYTVALQYTWAEERFYILPKIYKYAYTKMAPIEVFKGKGGGAVEVEGARCPCPTSSAYGITHYSRQGRSDGGISVFIPPPKKKNQPK